MRGIFKARAIDSQFGMSNNGNEQVAVMFQIIGGEHDGEKIAWFGSFTEKTEQRTFDSLRHCGWVGDDIVALDGIGSTEVELDIDEEQAQDQNGQLRFNDKNEPIMRSRVKWVNKPRALALKNQMNPQQAAAFAARMKGKAIAHRQKYGAPAATASNGSKRSQSAGPGFDPRDDGPSDEDLY